MLDDFREWLSDNLRYILLGLAVVLILVIGFCVFKLVSGSSEKDTSSGTKESEISTEVITEAGTQTGTTESTKTAETAAAAESDLVKDDAAILTLVRQYYTAAAAKDVTTLEGIVSPWNEEVKESILQNDVIESYNNISTYSKKGPVDNSYVVYTYYEGKVANIDTLVPSLSMLYLTTDASGSLIVSDRNESQEVSDYIATTSADADVQALISDVNQQCETAKNSDTALKEFMDSLDTASDSQDSSSDTSDTTAASGDMVSTTELNVRAEPSTDAAIAGVATTGTTVKVLQDMGDGWCQISYTSGGYTIEGYVRTEYLSSADSSGSTDTSDAGTASTESTADTTASGSAVADASDTAA